MTDEENHGPLFSGTEEDLYRTAFENVTAVAQKVTGEELIALYCENCGKPADKVERCETCLFYWCTKCINSMDHLEQHRLNMKNEERA